MKIIYVFILLLIAVFSAQHFLSYDCVDREFSQIIDCFGLDKPVGEMRDWYKVFNISDSQKAKLLEANFKELGYGAWQPFKSMLSLPGHLSIDGNKSLIFYVAKDGSDEDDGVYIFLIMDANQVVLVYGRTYGI